MSISYQGLVLALEECRDRSRTSSLTLGEAFGRLHEATYSLVCLVLCLPFLQPISLGPLACIGGLTFAALGWQLARGQETPWVPSRVRNVAPGPQTWAALVRLCLAIVRFCKRFTKPRLQTLVTGRRGDRLLGLLIVTAGLLMAIPFFGLPFNNTLPALAIVAACIAELEDDGVFVLVSLAILAVTVVYFALVTFALFSGMNFVFDYLGVVPPEFVRELLGAST